MEAERKLPELVRSLLRDYDFEGLRLAADLNIVMVQVLGNGSKAQVRWLVRRLGDDAIRVWITSRRGRGLSVEQMAPWVSRRTARRWQAADPTSFIWQNR
jgi:site-specific recombinase XerC